MTVLGLLLSLRSDGRVDVPHDGGLTVDALIGRLNNKQLEITLLNFIIVFLSRIHP